jgi:uncharacterized protein
MRQTKIICCALMMILASAGAAPAQDEAWQHRDWSVKIRNDNIFKYMTHGSAVHGHEVALVKRPGDCSQDALWISWSTYEAGTVAFEGTDVRFNLDVDGTKFNLDVPLVSSTKVSPTLTILTFYRYPIDEKLITAFGKGNRINVSIGSPKELLDLIDIPSDSFSLNGFVANRLKAGELCERRRLKEKITVANLSEAEAYHKRGLEYFSGEGAAQDYIKAANWFRKAAEAGDIDAWYDLGVLYYNGLGVEQDFEKAASLYRKSAANGFAKAQHNLALMHAAGEGVQQDDTQAAKWMRKAADQGLAPSQQDLAMRYRYGKGVPQDHVEAAKWYQKAAEQGLASAQFSLAVIFQTGRGVEEDAVEAVRWYRKAAVQGHVEAQSNLGMSYRTGTGVEEDDAEAVKWIKRAAEQGDALAQKGLGFMYVKGEGVAVDFTEAKKWLRMAAEQGNVDAQRGLGFIAEKEAVEVSNKSYRHVDTFRDCDDCPEMIVIPSGRFRMGDISGAGVDDEKPVHDVRINYSFAVGKFEVTQIQWRVVMRDNPAFFKGDNQPVERVSWDDVKTFLQRLSSKTGHQYRLLSEAEWEYVARAGSTSKYHWGNTLIASKYAHGSGTEPVGSYAPNAFGLHDMHGNVWEWTEDCWNKGYTGSPADGSAWLSGNCDLRVLRGGSWYSGIPRFLRAASRFRGGTDRQIKVKDLGFRIARTLSRRRK